MKKIIAIMTMALLMGLGATSVSAEEEITDGGTTGTAINSDSDTLAEATPVELKAERSGDNIFFSVVLPEGNDIALREGYFTVEKRNGVDLDEVIAGGMLTETDGEKPEIMTTRNQDGSILFEFTKVSEDVDYVSGDLLGVIFSNVDDEVVFTIEHSLDNYLMDDNGEKFYIAGEVTIPAIQVEDEAPEATTTSANPDETERQTVGAENTDGNSTANSTSDNDSSSTSANESSDEDGEEADGEETSEEKTGDVDGATDTETGLVSNSLMFLSILLVLAFGVRNVIRKES